MSIKADVMNRLSNVNVVNALRIAAKDILADAGKRIFTDGLDSSGSEIGQYSTKPIYISKKNSPRIAGDEKESTLYFPGGYKQFKEDIGRGSKVNLRVFGNLMRDYLASKEITGEHTITYELKDEENINKKGWMEEKYKKDIFSLTDEEKKKAQRTFEFEINRLMQQ